MATAILRRQVTSIVTVPPAGQALGGAAQRVSSRELVPMREEICHPDQLETPAQIANVIHMTLRHVAEVTQGARSLPVLGGAYFPNVSLKSASPQVFAHTVDGIVSFIPCRIRLGASQIPPIITEVGQDNNGRIAISTTADCLADLWFFPQPGPGSGAGVAGGLPVGEPPPFVNPSTGGVGVECFNVRVFGARGDGVHDDTTSILAAESARALTGGRLCFPPGIYRVTGPISTTGGTWEGVQGASIIRSSIAYNNLLTISGECRLSGLTFDANRLANNCVMGVNCANSVLEHCVFSGFLRDGYRAAKCGIATIGPVTKVGGGPLLDISQIDPNFAYPPGTNNAIKITLGGAPGTATFQFSSTGVAGPYGPATQTLFAQNQIGIPGSTNFVTESGLLVTAQAGTYVLDTTYAWTTTVVDNNNNHVLFNHCAATRGGTLYATAGLVGGYSAGTYNNPVTATGTVATIAGSNVVTGTGTQFLSMNLRDGSPILFNHLRFMVSVVLSNTVLILDGLYSPQFTLSGLDFVAAAGAGWAVDVETGQQLGDVLAQCRTVNCVTFGRFSGLGGPNIISPQAQNYAVTACTIGSNFVD